MSVIESIDFAGEIAERQMEIPGLDGYRAEKLVVSLSGGDEYTDVTQADDVEFVRSFNLGQEVKLLVTGTVTKKGFVLTPGKDEMTDDKTSFGVGIRVHTVEAV